MAHKRWPPNDPREWLNRARSNLARASREIPGVYFEDLCFDAQQCVEKAIKAVFLHRGWTFPFTHDIARLITLLEEKGVIVPKYIRRAEDLSNYAVETRYPGMSDPVTRREYESAVRIAARVLKWAERQTL